MLGTIGRILKWVLLLVLVIAVALLALRSFRVLGGPALQPWHTYVPTELSAEQLDAADWGRYLAQEDDIMSSVRAEVSQKLAPEQRVPINRYFEASPVYPARFAQDWNRSYVMEPDGKPLGVVVLLHGLTDSPYSLRHFARHYREHGFVAIGLRLPAHGTVPAGLSKVRWEDWMAATRLAVREARRLVPAPAPLHLVGFSNGGALAMKYSLDALEDQRLARAERIVLFTPMIGITRFARFAGLASLPALLPPFANAAWLSVIPEFNPFKYNSFPVNGARQSFRLTDALQAQIQRLAKAGQLGGLPPVLTFQSAIDFTVSTPAILSALYAHLPDNGSEIVLFDVNRTLKFAPLLRPSSYVAVDRLAPTTPVTYRFTTIANASDDSDLTVERSIAPGQLQPVVRPLGLPYPPGIFSLSHLSIPIPMDDPLYGMYPDPKTKDDYGYNLGAMDARGERGALIVDQDFLTRLSSNPFFPYLLERIDGEIKRPSGPSGLNIATTTTAGLPVRLEAVFSTLLPSDEELQPFAGP
ncbi:MAG: 2-succinyl-6-hydroxy-2,4-cyclohexadiene-1-carboxylate synthase [Candidatus Accumulibacter adjunctus]|uniref:2-succinyl-6-hydroxy-2, 4-cyclohexadiene-1-carboxylate synthase n=1 Tax=Candidatus Accumulibacter adjunctus TaxID=1454001 RepID=A0A011PTP8_9PROT|nr:MAG: 2-succinyl-6-hydroxy-2,4-cyclohexadiene-1-carboxylate synthase [Candidatus Accumulibacter adjunctus]